MTSESTVQRSIRLAFSERGIITFRMQSGTFLTPNGHSMVKVGVEGMSDLLCILPTGQAAWIETKRPKGGKQSDVQKNFIAQMITQGCKAGFAKSLEEAINIVEGTNG